VALLPAWALIFSFRHAVGHAPTASRDTTNVARRAPAGNL
jgi:hypothetical protein